MKRIILLLIFLMFISIASAVNIDYDASTPDNGTQSETYINISYTATDTNDTYSFIDFNDSLVGWWRMDNDSGVGENDTHIYDWSGNGNNATSVDAMPNATGNFGGSFFFDGVSDWILVPASASYDSLPATYNFTVSFWANSSTNTPSNAGISWGGTDDLIIYPFDSVGGNGVRVFWRDVGSAMIDENGVDRTGSYHHFVFVSYAPNNHKLYIDGDDTILSSTATGTAGPFSSPAIAIGSWRDDLAGQEFNGSIDEVLIFNRSFSANEVISLHNATSTARNFTSLSVGDYTFTAYAVDNSSDMNKTAERTITISTGTPNATSLTHSKGEMWVNHTWAAGSGNVTDSYNVSVNSTWHNTTTVTYHNNTGLSALTWSNITVWAYNSTHDELSTGSVSENVQTNASAGDAPWTPPIGIPSPDFGIDEIAPDDPASWPGSETVGHYFVDKTHGSCSDANTYGYPDVPRCSCPEGELAAGTVLYIDAGTYDGIDSSGDRFNWCGDGTASNPIWIRGNSSTHPTFQEFIHIGETGNASYIIIENLDINGAADAHIEMRLISAGDSINNISVRNCVFTGTHNSLDGNAITLSAWLNNATVRDIVIYNNTMSEYGEWNNSVVDDWDEVAVYMCKNTSNIWIVDNEMYHFGGDAIGGGHSSDTHEIAQYVYIGRNTIYECDENSIDLKGVQYAVVSENDIYGPYNESEACIVLHYGAKSIPVKDSYIMFNTIHNATAGVACTSCVNVSTIGNIFYDIYRKDAVYSVGADTQNGAAIRYRGTSGTNYVTDNTITDYETGILLPAAGTFNIHGNILTDRSEPVGYDVYVASGSTSDINYTQFYNGTGNPRIFWQGSTYTSVADFITGESECGECNEGDPQLVNAPSDFALQSTSPCIDDSVEGDFYDAFYAKFGIGVEVDYNNVSRPQNSIWDIGAYEYIVTAAGDTLYNNSSVNNADTFFTSDYMDNKYGTNTYLRAGDTDTFRTVMNFTLPSGDGAISAIDLYIYRYAVLADSDASVLAINNLTTDFVEAEANWNNSSNTQTWTSQGGDYDATIIDTMNMGDTGTSPGWIKWTLRGAAATNSRDDWGWGDTITFMLRQSSGSFRRDQFYSKENVTNVPYLSISYSQGEPNITSYAPVSMGYKEVYDSQEFNITSNQSTTCNWYINGSLVETDTINTEHSYTNTSLNGGYFNVTADAGNANGNDTQEWLFEVGANSITYIVYQDTPTNQSMIAEWNVTRIGGNVTVWSYNQTVSTSGWNYSMYYTNGTFIVNHTAAYTNETLLFNGTSLLPIGVYYISVSEDDLTAHANQYFMFNNWTTSQTFSQIAANVSNDVVYSWYNHTSGLHEGYYVGRSYNADKIIPENCSVFGFFDAETTIDVAPTITETTIPDTKWFYTYLLGTSTMNVSTIKASMDTDGLDCWAAYRWNGTGYNATGDVKPCEGIIVYVNNTGEWTI